MDLEVAPDGQSAGEGSKAVGKRQQRRIAELKKLEETGGQEAVAQKRKAESAKRKARRQRKAAADATMASGTSAMEMASGTSAMEID